MDGVCFESHPRQLSSNRLDRFPPSAKVETVLLNYVLSEQTIFDNWTWHKSFSVINGGVTASTEMLAARRHTGAHSPVSGAKTIIANSNQFAYAA